MGRSSLHSRWDCFPPQVLHVDDGMKTCTTMKVPLYRERLSINDLRNRASELRDLLRECTLCPRECGARRLDGKYGVCRTTDQVFVSSFGPHHGEEAPLVGTHGSGTIFFSSCNLKCLYCQNYTISHLRFGEPMTANQLAEIMLALQRRGCHNVNLVSPTHVVPQIVEALVIAVGRGLSIPIVYNCGGYESLHTLKLLENIVDVYMPDIKYASNAHAKKYSGADDYWDVVRPAIAEMHRQVGDLRINGHGVAVRGLLIRHLVLPNRIAGSKDVLDFVAKEISPNTYVNIMDQYRPAYKVRELKELNRPISVQEYYEVITYARQLGLHRGFDGYAYGQSWN